MKFHHKGSLLHHICTVLTRPRLFVCVNVDFCVTTEFKCAEHFHQTQAVFEYYCFSFPSPPSFSSPHLSFFIHSLFPSCFGFVFFCPRTSFICSRLQLCAGVFPHYDSSVYCARVERHPISRLGAPATRRVLPPLGNHGNHTTLCPVCVTEESTGRT